MLYFLEFFGVNSQPAYFIAAPSVFRLNAAETVSISVVGVNNVPIKLYLQDFPGGQNRLYERTVTVSEDEVQNTTFLLQSSDFPATDNATVQYVALIAESSFPQMSFTERAVILLSRKSGYIFIQTDKPVYTPNQEVKIRVIALDETRRPSTIPVHIDVKNPQGVIVQRKNGTYQGTFITDSFKLPPRPFYGSNWTITARFLNGLETSTVIAFEVKEYVLPKFSITIQTEPEIILPTTQYVRINVSASYFHGESVDGTCIVTYGIITDGQQQISDVDLKREMTSGSTNFVLKTLTLSDRFPQFWFPDGARLYLEVTILDKGTGRRQKITDKSTIFSNYPYRLSTAKSQKYFKPGLLYELKIESFLANGVVAPHLDLILNCKKTSTRGGIINFGRTCRTDKNGHLTENIILHYRDASLDCTIKTDKDKNEFEESLQTKVTKVIQAMHSPFHKFLKIKATLNADQLSAEIRKSRRISSNQFVHLLISSGSIMSVLKTRGSNSNLKTINSDLGPNMRIVTYVMDQHRGRRYRTFADSAVVEVKSTCHQRELEITVLNTDISPKSVLNLNVTGPPLSKVGFLAVDKAVYQISDKNRMQKKKMFSTFDGHDLGCSNGGGMNVNKVFEDAGLTIITNTGVKTPQRNSIDCQATGRRKRSIDPRQRTNPCCHAGDQFGQTHIVNSQECHIEGQSVHSLTNSSVCAKAFYRCCMSHDSPRRAFEPVATSGINTNFFDFDRMVVDSQDEEYTFRDINTLVENVEIRSFFPESWMFDENLLDVNGGLTKTVLVPDSVTTHVLEAVSLSPLYGMCIAEPVEIISTKDFFVDLDLPYSVVRMEQTEIRATLFNYKSYNLPCHVRLQETDGICSTEQDTISIDIAPNDVQLVRFPIVPMRAGEFTVDVIILCVNVGDRIQKTLQVVNEGREEKKTVSFWLDPKGRRRHHHDESDINIQVTHPFHTVDTQITTVDLTLPQEAIPGTGQCKLSAIGNIMDAAVQTILGGVDTLLDNVPHGCGEQTMIIMAPIVYAMRYLQRTNGLTPQAENRAKFFMKVGYQRELAFRKTDGSFSVWQHKPSSTWLTAFVLKVFCQAKTYIDIDQNVICGGMNWLFSKQNNNGSFTENSAVYHKEIMGGINGEASLTAFVLISMLECDCRMQGTSDNIRRAVLFLERQFLRTHHPYSLAISSYALALANSGRKWRVNNKLRLYAKFTRFPGSRHRGYRYWPIETSDYHNQSSIPYWYRKNPSAVSIETTAYALLTQLELDKIIYSHNIVEWLIEQQQASGAFISTQDTIVGLQALSMYNIRSYAEDIDMRCTVSTSDNSTYRTLQLREHEAMVEKSVHNIPATGKLHVTTSGSGVARMELEVSYNVNDTETLGCKFDINIYKDNIDVDIVQIKQSDRESICDVCGECHDVDFDEDYDVLLSIYNVPDPDPRIGFSNDNVQHASTITGHFPRLPIQDRSDDLETIGRSTTTDLGRSSHGGNRRSSRRSNRRPSRRRGRSTRLRRRGASRQQKCIEICVAYLGNEILDMPVIDVGLPTGFFVEDEDLKKVAEEDFIDSYEVSMRSITFYMEKIPQEEVCIKLRMIMEFEVENLQSAKIEVYDYSKKDERCVKFYSLQYDVAELDVFCSKENCHCVEGECAENWDNKLKSSIVTGKTLFDMTCQGYDYVLRIEVAGSRIVGNHVVTSTVIHSVINKVTDNEDLTDDSEVDFWMNLRCSDDLLQQGQFYIIYGNGGYKYVDEFGTERYRYYLQGDSIVMMDYTRELYNPDRDATQGYWQRFFTHMENHIKENGC